ncbi:MAG: hypothetical protein P9M03_01660 [Candidatus Theseobacter exili]|nr:hypothetical protein [Candidatus Theseobacter exili]
MFHLLQTASIHNKNIDAGFTARGLHGEAYRGHIFWDEMFAMAFYDLHFPETAEALLKYRFKRLPQARAYAKEHGYKGSMFPWQSGSSGVEETQIIHLNPLSGKWGSDHSCLQRHVSFAIAYNVWQHWLRTRDKNFLLRYGAELLLSIAQFGSSLVKYDNKDGLYHTKGIMGPDEFHEKLPGSHKAGLTDNAYSNLMIVRTLLKAKSLFDILPKKKIDEFQKKLGIGQKELNRWDDITKNMAFVSHEEGVISQFDGYFKLKEVDLVKYQKKYNDIHRMDRILKSEGKSPDEYKVAKQADVLMIFYLFSAIEIEGLFKRLDYKFTDDILRKNYYYYIKRTSHGSTLSKVVHCNVARLIGEEEESWHLFREVLESDIYDIQGGTTPEGIHSGVMGGSIDLVVRGMVGLWILEDYIEIKPELPPKWSHVQLKFKCMNKWIHLTVTKNSIDIFIEGKEGEEMGLPFKIKKNLIKLQCGKKESFSYK